MPDLNGVELAERLRKQGVDAPVVLITGHSDDRLPARRRCRGNQDPAEALLDENLVKRSKAIAGGHPVSPPALHLRKST